MYCRLRLCAKHFFIDKRVLKKTDPKLSGFGSDKLKLTIKRRSYEINIVR
jgi:hypothetical protein